MYYTEELHGSDKLHEIFVNRFNSSVFIHCAYHALQHKEEFAKEILDTLYDHPGIMVSDIGLNGAYKLNNVVNEWIYFHQDIPFRLFVQINDYESYDAKFLSTSELKALCVKNGIQSYNEFSSDLYKKVSKTNL